MPRFIVDLELDGYENDQEMADACLEFINEQLNFSASSVEAYTLKESGMTLLTKERFNDLLESEDFLQCLHACGVDNWEGYSDAQEMQDENEEDF